MNRAVVELAPKELPVAHAILALAAEHMHRHQGLDHWYPFPDVERYRSGVAGRQLYGVRAGEYLVATFDLSPVPEPHHDVEQWPGGAVPAMYFGGFAVLPTQWGAGVGTWTIQEAERIAAGAGATRFRFDAVTSNRRLLAWYDRLGYVRAGEIWAPFGNLTCFERVLR